MALIDHLAYGVTRNGVGRKFPKYLLLLNTSEST